MLNRMNRWLLAGIAALGLGASAIPAKAGEETKTLPAKAAEQNNVKQGGAAIDFARLGQLLDDMGFETKKVGDSGYDFVLKREGWTVSIRASLSTDGSRLWLMSSLQIIDDVGKVPADVLVQLLEGNFTHSTSFFYMYNPKDVKKPSYRILTIARTLGNRGINARALRDHVDTLFATIRTTMPLWKASEWKVAKPEVVKTEAKAADVAK